MPTYEYKCLACDNQFERFQGITAPPLEECPECHGKVKRLIGAGAGLIFKGSGFYITDYRSEGYKESAKKIKTIHRTKALHRTKARRKKRKPIRVANQSANRLIRIKQTRITSQVSAVNPRETLCTTTVTTITTLMMMDTRIAIRRISRRNLSLPLLSRSLSSSANSSEVSGQAV